MLLPSDPFKRAKDIELIRSIELNNDLVTSCCLPVVFFFGATVRDDVQPDLNRGIATLKQLLVCRSHIVGKQPILADLPDIEKIMSILGERESIQRTEADRLSAAQP